MNVPRGKELAARDFGAREILRPESEVARAFRGALRHSRLVRFLRKAIPAGVVVCLLAIAAMNYLNPLRLLRLPADFGNLVVSGTKITMEAPRLAGFTRDSRAYEVTANAASQDFTRPEVIELKDIRAKFDTEDKGQMQISAASGTYDAKSEMLLLGPDIAITSKEYEGQLSEASVDVRAGTVVSEKPVQVKFLKGTLNSNRLEVRDSGKLVIFGGGVDMILNLEAADLPKADAGAQ
jgi:lipopolysaccharide export system protein LptC